MTFMTWNDKLSVGVASIDEDHRKLIGLIDELYEGLQSGHSKEVLCGVLDRLVDYTQYHFEREEGFLRKTGYPEIAEHKKEHDTMTEWVLDVHKQYKNGTLVAPTLEVMNYLKDWLYDHILGSDQKYSFHLHAKGIR